MHRVLIVRLGALGDIVHAIPVAAALRRAVPSARIDWLVSARHREILDLVSILDRRIAISDRTAWGSALSLPGAIRALRHARYDVAVDLQGLVKSAAIARLSGAARVIGFGGRYVREALARFFYTTAHDPGGPGTLDRRESRHVVQLNLELLKPLAVPVNAVEFPLAPVSSPAADRVREAAGGAYALLNPGAAWPNKRWPPDRLAALARAIRERHGIRSVVLWGPGERPLGEQVVAQAAGAAVLTPETSIADIVALARGARVMVSGDTGPTHVAAAVGTPIVGIFGPTRPERNGPWRTDDVTVSRSGVCECHHLRRCRRERMCLLDIGTDEVIAAVDRRLARSENVA